MLSNNHKIETPIGTLEIFCDDSTQQEFDYDAEQLFEVTIVEVWHAIKSLDETANSIDLLVHSNYSQEIENRLIDIINQMESCEILLEEIYDDLKKGY